MSSTEEVDFEEEVQQQTVPANTTNKAEEVGLDDDGEDMQVADEGKGPRNNNKDNRRKSGGGKKNESSGSDIKIKGRGHNRRTEDDDRYDGKGGVFEKLEQGSNDRKGPLQCELFSFLSCIKLIVLTCVTAIEGWIIFISNVHQEAQEDDILDKFSDFGDVKNIHVNLDRRTGFVKVSLSAFVINPWDY
jgi:hypothetical protein